LIGSFDVAWKFDNERREGRCQLPEVGGPGKLADIECGEGERGEEERGRIMGA